MSTEQMEELKQMPEHLYWEWRTTCEELAHIKTKVELQKSLQIIFEQRVKITQQQVLNENHKLKSIQTELSNYEVVADKMKERIESELEIDFTNCVVGDDLMIRKLDQGV